MDYTAIQDFISTVYTLQDATQQTKSADMTFIKQIPLDATVNQCQGFTYNSKKDVFVLACINSENTKQIIYELDPTTFDVVKKQEYSDPKLLAHMNTLTYNPDTNLLYTTNAVVNGYIVTPIDADTLAVKDPIQVKEKVFNLAYDTGVKQFVSIVPVDDSLRRINYYSPSFSLLRSAVIDAKHHDLNNNGAYSKDGSILFTTLSTIVSVNANSKVQSIVDYPKGIEIEDIDTRNGIYYAAVNTKPGVAIYRIN